MNGDSAAANGNEPTLVVEARRVYEHAVSSGVEVRLLGGVAIWLRASEEMRQDPRS